MEQGIGRSSPQEGTPQSENQNWDIGAVSQAFGLEPHSTRDSAHGPGVRFHLGGPSPLEFELFPPHGQRLTGIVRVSTADSFQEFSRQPAPAIRAEGLVFESKEFLISLSPAGELLTHRLTADTDREMPSDASAATGGPTPPRDEDGGPSGDYAAPQTVYQDPLPTSERQPRVEYGGRLGIGPRSKTTRTGRFVMEFPVAVRVEGRDKAEWRDTVVFDEKARKLDGQLQKGTYVDVVAYEHTKRRTRQGKTQDVTEYYATSVTPRRKTREGGIESE